jgi:hypothetical protein
MDVTIEIPQTPVTLVAGTESRLPIEVLNRSGAPLAVRLGVSRSRGGAWAELDDPVLELGPGERREVDVVFRPPANVLPTSTLMPFTVHAEELPFGVPAGRATGLLTVSTPERVGAILAVASARRRRTRYTVALTNRCEASLTVALEAKVDPAPKKSIVDPPVVELPGGQSVTARIRVRPRRAVIGSPSPYRLAVSCRDAAAEDAQPLVTVTAVGIARPRLRSRTATVLTCLVLVLGIAAGLMFTGRIDAPAWVPWQPSARDAPTGPNAPAAADVRRPYALVDVFTQQGDAGRVAAEAARTRLAAAGMPVRLVDSRASDQVADGPGGLWVLLQDGMPTVEAVRAYCDRYRPLAPKCDVVP